MAEKQKRNKKSKKDNNQRSLQLISTSKSFQYVEAYKTLRTNLDFMGVGQNYQKIVITSAIPGEGKSNIAINLAVSIAETGKSVVLVDCDLRKPMMHKYLRIGRTNAGVTNVLSGAISLKDAIVHFGDLAIDVLPAGAIPPNPAELLGGRAMQNLIEWLTKNYDYVLLDTPPVSVVTDAAVLGRLADGVIMVVRQKHSTIQAAQLAKKNLETAGVRIIGAVLNGFDAKGLAKDTGYYYSYEYDYRKEK